MPYQSSMGVENLDPPDQHLASPIDVEDSPFPTPLHPTQLAMAALQQHHSPRPPEDVVTITLDDPLAVLEQEALSLLRQQYETAARATAVIHANVASLDNLPCLLDSGAEMSTISPEMYALLKTTRAVLANEILDKSHGWVRSVSGHRMRVQERALINITIGGTNYPYWFTVLPQAVYPIILGIDFMLANGMMWDMLRKRVTFLPYDMDLSFVPRAAADIQLEEGDDTLGTLHVTDRSFRFLPKKINSVPVFYRPFPEAPPPPSRDTFLVFATPTIELFNSGLVMTPGPIQLTWDDQFRAYRGRLLVSNPNSRLINVRPRTPVAQVCDLHTRRVTIPEGAAIAALAPEPSPAASPDAQVEHLMELMGVNKAELSPTERARVRRLLLEYLDRFVTDPSLMGRTDLVRMSIEVSPGPPCRVAAYRYHPREQQYIRDFVNDLLDKSVIRPSTSAWAAPVVIVYKKDGTPRFCIDYRRVNARMHKEAFPLPSISEYLDALGNAAFFSTLDLKDGFWQMLLEEGSKHLTAFTTGFGLYEWNTVPMGLANSPTAFQRMMNTVLIGLIMKGVLIYMDDIMVYGETFDDHFDRLREVLQRLRLSGLTVKPKKCALFQREVDYLGHHISREGVKPLDAKIKILREWPQPTKVKHVRSFVGFASYYRRFVPHFSTIAAPLHRLTAKHAIFKWEVEHQAAFDALKLALTTQPLLMAHPDWNRPFIITTDASDTGLGAVLGQRAIDDDPKMPPRPIYYLSRSLTNAERDYTTTERECLAIVWAIRKLRCYIYGREFRVITDHQALKWLNGQRTPGSRTQRWILELQAHNFIIEHRPGAQHHDADALSRLPIDLDTVDSGDSSSDDEEDSPYPNIILPDGDKGINAKMLPIMAPYSWDYPRHQSRRPLASSRMLVASKRAASPIIAPITRASTRPRLLSLGSSLLDTAPTTSQEASTSLGDLDRDTDAAPPLDDDLPATIQEIRLPELPATPDETRDLQDHDPELAPLIATADGIISPTTVYYVNPDNGLLYHVDLHSRAHQLCVPLPLRPALLQAAHDSPTSGHFGVRATLHRLRRYFWKSKRRDVTEYCKLCRTCQEANRYPQQTQGVQRPFLATAPFQIVFIDLMELEETPDGYRYVLGCIDAFTRYVEAVPLRDKSGPVVAEAILVNLLLRHGCVERLVTDQGSEFTARQLYSLCHRLIINKHLTTVARPQTNGAIERWNRTLQHILRKIQRPGQNWAAALPIAVFAYNTSYHSALRDSPYFFVYGRDPRLPIDQWLLPSAEQEYDPEARARYRARIVPQLMLAWRTAHQHLSTQAQLRADRRNDNHAVQRHFAVGEAVYAYIDSVIKKGKRRKLKRHWQGPFRVIHVDGDNTYTVLTNRQNSPHSTFHVSKLKPYYGPNNIPPVEAQEQAPIHERIELDERECPYGVALEPDNPPPLYRDDPIDIPEHEYRLPTDEELNVLHHPFVDDDGHVYEAFHIAYDPIIRRMMAYCKAVTHIIDPSVIRPRQGRWYTFPEVQQMVHLHPYIPFLPGDIAPPQVDPQPAPIGN